MKINKKKKLYLLLRLMMKISWKLDTEWIQENKWFYMNYILEIS